MTIIDAHTHIIDAENDQAPLYALAKSLDYRALNVLSLQCCGLTLQNLLCAACKLAHPDMTYAFGGLDYETGRDYLSQAKNLREMGFDGIKMLEAKPTTRKLLNRSLDDPSYDAYYYYLEETGFPVLFHVADPGTFWDWEKIPKWAKDEGWFYDESYVPYAQYYTEVDNMLRKHPRLNAVFAHFFFLSGDPARAQRFLDEHPGVYIDITAGIEMYEDFSKDPAFWRAFFIKNQSRIIFGTDSTDEAPAQNNAEDEKVALNGYGAMEIAFLTQNREIEIFGMKLHGLGLPEDAQARIFSENFLQYVGGDPRALNRDALKNEAALIRGFLKNDGDIKKLERIAAAF